MGGLYYFIQRTQQVGVSASSPPFSPPPWGFLDQKQAHKTNGPTLGRGRGGLLQVKGVPIRLKSPPGLLLNLKHRGPRPCVSGPARLGRSQRQHQVAWMACRQVVMFPLAVVEKGIQENN